MNSIIVVVHNVPVRTQEIHSMTKTCLETLVNTADLDYELICIDNGSDDNQATFSMMVDVLRPYEGKNNLRDLVVSWKEGNKPVSTRWNEAVQVAKGDVIVLLNNDMVFRQRGWLSMLDGPARRSEVGAVGSRSLHWNGFYFLEGSILAFRKEVALETAGDNYHVFDEQFEFSCEDADFSQRLQNRGKQLVTVPVEECCITHLHHGTLCWTNEEGGWNGRSILDVMHESRRKLCRKYGKAEKVND